jgi:hypothetical protein
VPPKAICPECRQLKSECICETDDVLDLPPDCGPLIAAMLGPAPGEEPPGTYVFRFPQEETDDDGNPVEGDAGPECVPFTIDRDAG